jgi:hypothetical protein
MGTGHLREGAWINAGTGQWSFIDEHADWATLPKDSKLCPWCSGSTHWGRCGGSGKAVHFEPYICVEHSLSRPVSITLAAFSGAPWRFIRIPDEALALGAAGLLAWVSIRVLEHYRQENGKCPLYGDIEGYRLVQAPGVSVILDTEGRYVEMKREEFVPGTASLEFGNKIIELRRDGTVKIEAVKRQAR